MASSAAARAAIAARWCSDADDAYMIGEGAYTGPTGQIEHRQTDTLHSGHILIVTLAMRWKLVDYTTSELYLRYCAPVSLYMYDVGQWP